MCLGRLGLRVSADPLTAGRRAQRYVLLGRAAHTPVVVVRDALDAHRRHLPVVRRADGLRSLRHLGLLPDHLRWVGSTKKRGSGPVRPLPRRYFELDPTADLSLPYLSYLNNHRA